MKNVLLSIILIFLFTGIAFSSGWQKKSVNNEWTWLEDYFFTYATYLIACKPSRKCEIGTGVFAFGKPRGTKKIVTGTQEITVFGFGAIHMRSIDENGSVKVAISLQNKKLVNMPSLKW